MNTQEHLGTLSLAEASELCKCSPDRLSTLARIGAVPATKVGRRWVFPTRLLQEWVDDRSRANIKPYLGALRPPTITQELTASGAVRRVESALRELHHGTGSGQRRAR